MAVSRRLRFEILRRDSHTCRYCGRAAPQVELRVDHVHPVALGGTDKPENLVASCVECNAGKTSVPADAPTVANVAQDALRWARAIEAVAQVRTGQRRIVQEVLETVEEAWNEWTSQPSGQPIPRPQNWLDSVERFYLSGLDADCLTHFVGVAMRRPNVISTERWTYFCGCCWREIDSIQEEAKNVIAEIEASPALSESWADEHG